MAAPFEYFTDCVFNQHRLQMYFGGLLWNATFPQHKYHKCLLIYVKGATFREEHFLNPACFEKHRKVASLALISTKNQTRKKKQKVKSSAKKVPKFVWPTKIDGGQYKIGVDMSLKSPGIACVATDKEGNKHVICAFIPQRVRERNMIVESGNLFVKALDTVNPKDSQVIRMINVVKQVSECIRTLSRIYDVQTPVILEGYPYAKVSSSSSVLYELGGMLRFLLTESGVPYTVCSPSSAKKSMSGNGAADKKEVLTAAIERQYLPKDIYDLLSLRLSKSEIPPNPLQDIVDAIALATYEPKSGNKRKKRKKSSNPKKPKPKKKRC